MTTCEGTRNVPNWFKRAISTPGESRRVVVAGCPIHYLRWGDPARPGLLLVPPGGGHAHWFSHVAPLFADQFHVVAMDPAGCGDSGRRETYSKELVAREITGVLEHCEMLSAATRPVLMGHSAGAQGAVRAALANHGKLLGVIGVDGLRYLKLAKDFGVEALQEPRPRPRPARVYPTLEEALARFRLAPPPDVPVGNDYIVEHIARHSYQRVDGGWTAKHDKAQIMAIDLGMELIPALKDIDCRAATIYTEHGHIGDETAEQTIGKMTGGTVAVLMMQGATHFPQIDDPLGFVAMIKAIALSWRAEERRGAR